MVESGHVMTSEELEATLLSILNKEGEIKNSDDLVT